MTSCKVVNAASAAAQKLRYSALKVRQMDVVMGIVSERDVFTTRITKSLCYGRLPYTYDEAVCIFSITSSRYRVATNKTQRRFSSHCCTYGPRYRPPRLGNYRTVWKFQWHRCTCPLTPSRYLRVGSGNTNLCATFIWLPWDDRSCPYVCLYCAKNDYHCAICIINVRMRSRAFVVSFHSAFRRKWVDVIRASPSPFPWVPSSSRTTR